MSLSVTPVTAAQLPIIAPLLAAAFDDDPAYRFLFPHAATRPSGLADFFARNLGTHLPYRCTYVATEDASVVGTVTIRPPGGVPISLATMLRRGLIPFAWSQGPRAVKRLLLLKREYDALEERAMGSEPHRLVHMMAIAPNRQGRGLGTRLLADAIALSVRARGAASLPILLTTHTERNVAFYRRSTFAITERSELALAGAAAYPVWIMRRAAAG